MYLQEGIMKQELSRIVFCVSISLMAGVSPPPQALILPCLAAATCHQRSGSYQHQMLQTSLNPYILFSSIFPQLFIQTTFLSPWQTALRYFDDVVRVKLAKEQPRLVYAELLRLRGENVNSYLSSSCIVRSSKYVSLYDSRSERERERE